jgi:hypothetical protein
MNPNTTWSGSLDSYHPYLTPQKVSKNPQTYCVHNTLPKSAKSHFDSLRPLGVKIQGSLRFIEKKCHIFCSQLYFVQMKAYLIAYDVSLVHKKLELKVIKHEYVGGCLNDNQSKSSHCKF